MKIKLSPPLWLALILSGLYLALCPFTYFRHDDWFLLGNSVTILPKDWSLLWRPTLFFDPSVEQTWFFRPFVKLLVYLSYQAFGYHHWLWILFQWSLVLAAVFLAGAALDQARSPSQSKKGVWFQILFLASIHLHFSSVVWVGEGIMNAPQLFFLALSLWAFTHRNEKALAALSLVSYTVALGFKESSAFFPLFLMGVLFAAPSGRKDWKALLPHFLICGLFLLIRLGVLPLNAGYKPQLTVAALGTPLLYFLGGSFVLPLSCLAAFNFLNKNPIPGIKKFLWFVPFLLLLIAPHLGHEFFSPGWLLLPGFFSLWAFTDSMDFPPRFEIQRGARLATTLALLSLLPVAWKLNNLGWLSWSRSQREVHQFIRSLPEEGTRRVVIETCENAKRPQVTFERVIGGGQNLEHLWLLNHPHPTQFLLTDCLDTPRPVTPGEVVAKWDFPNFTRVP